MPLTWQLQPDFASPFACTPRMWTMDLLCLTEVTGHGYQTISLEVWLDPGVDYHMDVASAYYRVCFWSLNCGRKTWIYLHWYYKSMIPWACRSRIDRMYFKQLKRREMISQLSASFWQWKLLQCLTVILMPTDEFWTFKEAESKQLKGKTRSSTV